MQFEKIGVMVDCSRNAVPTIDTLKTFMDLMEKMGYNRLLLYTEDTYEIDSRPYFGYLRGRYTQNELKELDNYAAFKGIELMPCIQALAHVNQIFRWKAFENVRDCMDILLVDEPETYKLIDEMFSSLAKSFSSRNINIGCDEAHMVGLGKYLDKNGYQNRFDLINRHITKVIEIAKKYDFKCSMWSDMYFRLLSGGEYQVFDKKLPSKVLECVPKDLTLIYWDYYCTQTDFYRKMFKAHSQFDNEIEFAGGAWKWTGFAPDNAFSIKALECSIEAARESNIKNIMITAWGDDGAEASLFSILPSLYYFAQACKGESVEPANLENGFRELIGVGFSDFLDIEQINNFDWLDKPKKPNAEKFLLYNDCFSGIFDSVLVGDEPLHYRKVIEKLENGSYGRFSYIFDTIKALAKVLELKSYLGVQTRKAYRANNKVELCALAEKYEKVIALVENFHEVFEKQWLTENKPYGFDVQDQRLGGLIQRLKSSKKRLLAFCSGSIKQIPELDEDILPFEYAQGRYCNFNLHLFNYSANVPSHGI